MIETLDHFHIETCVLTCSLFTCFKHHIHILGGTCSHVVGNIDRVQLVSQEAVPQVHTLLFAPAKLVPRLHLDVVSLE